MTDPVPFAPAGIWVVFHADWQDPPGEVIATFATQAQAIEYLDGLLGMATGGQSFHVPAPGWMRP
jgi:hypothetical protein